MTKSQYTPEQKTEALAVYATDGLAAAVRATGIPKGTIRSWADRTGTSTVAPAERTAAAVEAATARRAELREDLRTKLLEKAVDMLERIDDPHVDFRGNTAERIDLERPSASDCQRYATAAAILLDKFRLEMGEATDLAARQIVGGRQRALAVVADLDAKRAGAAS